MACTSFGRWVAVKASPIAPVATSAGSLPVCFSPAEGGMPSAAVVHVKMCAASSSRLQTLKQPQRTTFLLHGAQTISDPSFFSDLTKLKMRSPYTAHRRCRYFIGTPHISERCESATSRIVVVASSLRTPHSGYHFDKSSRRFFEGWYFRVSLPEERDSFAFMYSVEDPGRDSSSHAKDFGMAAPLGSACMNGGGVHVGVGAQIMGPGDTYLMRYSKDVQHFWASRQELELGNMFQMAKPQTRYPNHMISAGNFASSIEQGFQVSTTFHQGVLYDDESSPHVSTVPVAKWEYSTVPVYGWGNVGERQKATAGWLAALPVFEPHWQVLMAAGKSTGWIEWGGKRFEFQNAPSYSEKNWGGSFPRKWFWVQCNLFEGAMGTVALTAGGGRRGTPLAAGSEEEVAMIGVHYDGKFYEFVPWNGKVSWDIAPWGSWKMSAATANYEAELLATTDSEGVVLRAPTAEAGLTPACKDTFSGKLKLKLWEMSNGRRGICVLDVTSDAAALEVGGGPWWGSWVNESEMKEPVRTIIGLPIDAGSLVSYLPGRFSLPGL